MAPKSKRGSFAAGKSKSNVSIGTKENNINYGKASANSNYQDSLGCYATDNSIEQHSRENYDHKRSSANYMTSLKKQIAKNSTLYSKYSPGKKSSSRKRKSDYAKKKLYDVDTRDQ